MLNNFSDVHSFRVVTFQSLRGKAYVRLTLQIPAETVYTTRCNSDMDLLILPTECAFILSLRIKSYYFHKTEITSGSCNRIAVLFMSRRNTILLFTGIPLIFKHETCA
jgi:hypothetical protein